MKGQREKRSKSAQGEKQGGSARGLQQFDRNPSARAAAAAAVRSRQCSSKMDKQIGMADWNGSKASSEQICGSQRILPEAAI